MDAKAFQINNRLCNAEKLLVLCFARHEFGLEEVSSPGGVRFRLTGQLTPLELPGQKKEIDLMYWDLGDLAGGKLPLARKHLELLSSKGMVFVDGGGSMEKLAHILDESFEAVLEATNFSVFARRDGGRSLNSVRYQFDLVRRRFSYEKERKARRQGCNAPPLVTVITLAYNHERFIAECLTSVLAQRGEFRMHIIIIDDASSDRTAETIRNVICHRGHHNGQIDFIVNPHNVGVVKNLARAIRLGAGCDYLTFCEGDDFWSSEVRIQEHLQFLGMHPECSMSFNTVEFCSADGKSRRVYDEQAYHTEETMNGNELAAFNMIGNFSACFYDGAFARIVPENLFDMYAVDWMFNLYCAQFGDIAHLHKPLSVYRQHDGSEWSSRKEWNKGATVAKLCDEYDKFLDFQYNKGFQKHKNRIFAWMHDHYSEVQEKVDLLILDDVFPAQCSGFRYTEFTTYLRELPKSVVLASGATLCLLDEGSLEDVIRAYQRRYPELGNRVMVNTGEFPIGIAKLLYVNFLNNAYALVPVAEECRIPFAFTLYPGGGFFLNDSECDAKLKRIFDSPCFRKVIVTQQMSYEYITSRKLCPMDKVELIFGVVMPQEAFTNPISKDKVRWGFEKNRLDICFMAHRYTARGEDKGYDVFIKAAHRLRKIRENIYFHVVGPYDDQVIDIRRIQDRIAFHGTLNPDQFAAFFEDKDIILSPNTSGKMCLGSFDGFPTASCTEAGLRGTAIFCTDEFDSAGGRFTDGEDIVLIKYDIDYIVDTVVNYYNKPEELKHVGERGSLRIRDLYSYRSQMVPRLRLLHEVIETSFVFDDEKLRSLEPCKRTVGSDIIGNTFFSRKMRILKWVWNHTPIFVKRRLKQLVGKCVRLGNV